MPLPTSPTILLAAGGLALVSGRYFHLRFQNVWGWYYFVALMFAAISVWGDPITSAVKIDALNIHRVWTNDSLAVSEQWIVLALGLLSGVAFFDSPLQFRNRWNSCGLLLFAIAGLMLVARSNDLLTLGMSLEIVSRAATAIRKGASSATASSPLGSTVDFESPHTAGVWIDWLSSGSIWFGIALVANALATTQFDAIRQVLVDAYSPRDAQALVGAPSKLVLLAVGMIVMGLFGRMGLVPFHLVLGTCGDRQSNQSCAMEMLARQLAGSVALTRLCGCVFVGLGHPLSVLIMVMVLTTFFLSGVMAVRGFSPGLGTIPKWLTSFALLQHAWLGVALMIVTIELEQPEARWGAFPQKNETLGLIVFLQFAELLAYGGICWTLGHLARIDRGIEFLEDVKGLGRFSPTASLALIVAMASAAGIPWTAGFGGRWLILLAGNNVHIKSTSSFFVPHSGLRFIFFVGGIATVLLGGAVIRMAREMFLESPLARRTSVGGRGPLAAGIIAALVILLLGIAPQILFVPLRFIEAPREREPEIPTRGSGRDHSVFRSVIKVSIEFDESLCQARCARQVNDHFLISIKLACCSWQSRNCWAQFCPVWSGTSSPGHLPARTIPSSSLTQTLERPKSEQSVLPTQCPKFRFGFRIAQFVGLQCRISKIGCSV